MALGRTTALALAVVALVRGASTDATAAILSAKRGFADTGAGYNNLQATGAGWYYTWGTGAANPGNFDAKHYPMFWNAPSQNTINNVRNRPGVEYVLGFNEPERADQANMTVAQAISSWTTISNSFAGTNIKLVSPAVADTGGAAGGQAWLSSFMSQAAAANLRVDAVAFHWYGVSTPANPAGAASSFLSRVDSYHNQYDKPVFITEFAIHDWGGAYTDAEIIEANRQFINIVIPELESRDYVAGYSWYHWFSDAPLYGGSPSKPTRMAYSYVGAVGPGAVANVGGQNLGEHVAYLTGGELTMTGAAGTVRYINALENSSTISGTVTWGLGGTNWVRIQPGATLRKGGANQIAFSSNVTNNGVLEVAQGTLRVSAPVGGNGSARVTGGTLALTGSARMDTSPLVDVRSGGTFDATGLSGGYVVPNRQTLMNNRNANVVGKVTAGFGSTVAGGGAFAGNLTAQLGATVRVGDGGQGVPTRFTIDNFESYALGDVRTVASPPWTAHQDTSLTDIETFGGTKVLTYGWASDFRGASRSLPEQALIDDSETATIFFRVNSKTDDPDHNVGLGDLATTGATNFGDFEAQVRLKQGSTAGTFALDARNGGGFSATLANGLALNSWYNVWMVVNQATDTYDVYMNTGAGAATAGSKLNATPLAFRNGTVGDLNTILALAGPAPVDNGVRIDDLVYLTGVDLTNPVGGFDPGLAWTAETLTVSGDYTQNPGAMLELNLFDPNKLDVLSVAGHGAIAGTLNVSLAVGAPAPQPGDVFDIFDFGSTSGAFDLLLLPSLEAGLLWRTSNLLTAGELEVVAAPPGDFAFDGDVDGDDFLAWQRGQSPEPLSASDLADWQTNYGATVLAATVTAAVPEPGAAPLALLAVASTMACRGKRRDAHAAERRRTSWPKSSSSE